jgi:hypothetical protein
MSLQCNGSSVVVEPVWYFLRQELELHPFFPSDWPRLLFCEFIYSHHPSLMHGNEYGCLGGAG